MQQEQRSSITILIHFMYNVSSQHKGKKKSWRQSFCTPLALTLFQHANFEALGEAACLASLPAPLGDLALVRCRTAVLNVTWAGGKTLPVWGSFLKVNMMKCLITWGYRVSRSLAFKLTFRVTLIILTAPYSVLFITPWQVRWINGKLATCGIQNKTKNKTQEVLFSIMHRPPLCNTHLGWSSWKTLCRLHMMPRRSGNPRPHPRTPNTASLGVCSGRTCSGRLRFRSNPPLHHQSPRLWSGSAVLACTAAANSAWCHLPGCLHFGKSQRMLRLGSSDPRHHPLGC